MKHLIDVAEPLAVDPNREWLGESVWNWRSVACISDYGLSIDNEWSRERIDVLVGLVKEACELLERREWIPAAEMEAWVMLDDMRLFARGADRIATAPVIQLGRAIIDLLNGCLPAPPAGKTWLFGTEDGPKLLGKEG